MSRFDFSWEEPHLGRIFTQKRRKVRGVIVRVFCQIPSKLLRRLGVIEGIYFDVGVGVIVVILGGEIV